MEWIKSSLWEVKRSKSLQLLGAVFALAHILTFYTWSNSANLFSQGQALLCWSFNPLCSENALFSPGQYAALINIYLGLSIGALFIFLIRRLIGFGWFLLALSFFMKSFFYLQDLTLAQNIHVLLFMAELSFLFIPNKGPIIRILAFSYYLCLGGIKLNSEWLSGLWLSSHLPFAPKGLEWIAAFTILIQMIAPFWLFSKVGQRFASAVTSLVILHAFQWYTSGYFEPLILFAFLVFFVFYFLEQKGLDREYLYQSYSRPEPTKIWWPIVFCLFWVFQVVPYVAPQFFQGNLFQVKAPPTPLECQHRTFIIYKNKTTEFDPQFVSPPSDNLKCNSFVHFSATQNLCKTLKSEPDFLHVASFFASRSTAESQFKRIFEWSNICDPQVTPPQGAQ